MYPNLCRLLVFPDKFESVKQTQSDRIDDARLFYDFLVHRRIVRFVPHPTRGVDPEKYEACNIVLNSKSTYDQVAAKVGETLGVDPTHIRFWTVHATTGNPKAAVKRNPTQNLHNILQPPYSTYNGSQRADALYFEVLDISLSELDTKKALKVTWLSEGITKEVSQVISGSMKYSLSDN